MQSTLTLLLFVCILSGCEKIPATSVFKSEGLILKNYRFDLPRVDLSKSSKRKYQFENVGFNLGKSPSVKFVVISDKEIRLSELDNLVSVEIWHIDGDSRKQIYSQASRLNAVFSEDKNERDISWRNGFSAPSKDAKSQGEIEYVGYSDLRLGSNLLVDISRFSKYEVILTNSVEEPVDGLVGFVRLSTSWK